MTSTTILSDNGVSSGSAGLKSSGGNDGTLLLQTSTSGGTATTAVTIDTSQNVGVGVTPSAWKTGNPVLQIGNGQGALEGISNAINIWNNLYRNSSNQFIYQTTNAAGIYAINTGVHAWYNAPSGTAGTAATLTQAMTLDASGNLGLGVTPSVGSDTVLQIQSGGPRLAGRSGFTNLLELSSNSYYTGGGVYKYINSTNATNYLQYLGSHQWFTAPSGTAGNAITFTQAMTLDASGNLLVNRTSGSNNIIAVSTGTQGTRILAVTDNGTQQGAASFYNCTNGGENAAACAITVKANSSTSRSINAGGTINASGADYAEYMTKAGDFTVAKGDVVGINAEGKLTNVFSDAVSFAVKSTDPSYVGADVWGNEEALGMTQPEQPSAEASDEEKAQYETNKLAFEAALEAARQWVDRIAFAGQVPVNVTGATAGQYIVPVNDNGAIKGEAVSNPTFEQYQQAVGKVIAIEQDGRARIIVKVA